MSAEAEKGGEEEMEVVVLVVVSVAERGREDLAAAGPPRGTGK